VEPVTVLSIAGSDAGGGAGIQADLRTFAAFAVHGTTALTAITAQNTVGVSAVEAVAPTMVRAQVLSVTDDFRVRATKTGMLATPENVLMVAELARHGILPQLVVDPVLVSSTGSVLLADGGVEAYREALIPSAYLVTPNLREAAVLANIPLADIRSRDDMVGVGKTIKAFGAQNVLVKGGHFASVDGDESAPDVLVTDRGVILFEGSRVMTTNDHGTGCSLSAAICAGLGRGRELEDATRDAKGFVLSALAGAKDWHLGAGRGPIDHLGWTE